MSTVILINRLRSSHNPYPGEITSIEEVTDDELRTRRYIQICDQVSLNRALAERRHMDSEIERFADMAMEDQK